MKEVVIGKNSDNYFQKTNIIINLITKELQSYNTDNYSLYNGNAGIALYFIYLYKYNKKKSFFDKANILINKCVEDYRSNRENDLLNLSSGFIGITWLIAHLTKYKIFENNYGFNLIEQLGNQVSTISNRFFEQGNIDVLHGALGGALFFLEANDTVESSLFLNHFIENMNINSIKSSTTLFWRSLFRFSTGNNNDLEYNNLGYAHGIPGFLKILGDIYNCKNSNKKLAKDLIKKGINYLLLFKNPNIHSNTATLFPYCAVSEFNEEFYNTRLGWCYGDLTIGYAIWKIGKSLNNLDYQIEGIEIAKHTALVRDSTNSLINDPFICHGSSGVAHIYNVLYQETNYTIFKTAANYWYRFTVDLFLDNYNEYILSPGLLSGMSGIGLSLLSFVDFNVKNWGTAINL